MPDQSPKPLAGELLAEGWKRSDTENNVLVNPRDPSMTVYVDLYTSEAYLSPELAEALRRQRRRNSSA